MNGFYFILLKWTGFTGLYGFFNFRFPVETEKLRSIRRKVARKMVTSMSLVPHVAHMDDADVTLLEEFRKEQGIDLRQDNMALQRLQEACEKAKCELSSQLESTVSLPFVTADASGPKHLNLRLSRSKFEQMIEPFVQRTLEPSRQALKDAGLDAKDVDESSPGACFSTGPIRIDLSGLDS